VCVVVVNESDLWCRRCFGCADFVAVTVDVDDAEIEVVEDIDERREDMVLDLEAALELDEIGMDSGTSGEAV